MTKEIYYGNIATHLEPKPLVRPFSSVTESTISFTGFDLSGQDDMVKKLDLLFYNRVNEIGEVLSSLVYISNPLELDDVTTKTYDVKKLYVNTDAERQMALTFAKTDFTYLNCKWATSKFFSSSISPMTDSRHEELAENGIPSVKIQKYGLAFDGWYTQLSVGVPDMSLVGPLDDYTRGIVAFHTYATLGNVLSILTVNAPAVIADDANWSPYYTAIEDGTTNPDGTILEEGTSLGNLLVTLSLFNPYVKQDLFVLPTYVALYENSVVQYAEYPTYGNPYPVLRDKHRIIHNYASENNFVEAQYVLQSTEFFRATTQV